MGPNGPIWFKVYLLGTITVLYSSFPGTTNAKRNERIKALANENTLLRTHCCPWCFLGCANWETFVADTKCFWTKSETFFCVPDTTMNRCCARGQTGKHLCRQPCVRNNASSFTRAFTHTREDTQVTNFESVVLKLNKHADKNKIKPRIFFDYYDAKIPIFNSEDRFTFPVNRLNRH